MLLPLVYRCRAMGCVYLLAPWDIHAELGKAALQEMAALLASGGSQWGGSSLKMSLGKACCVRVLWQHCDAFSWHCQRTQGSRVSKHVCITCAGQQD